MVRLTPVAHRRQGRGVLPIDLDVQSHQVLVAPLQKLVLHGSVPLAPGLDLIEKISDHLLEASGAIKVCGGNDVRGRVIRGMVGSQLADQNGVCQWDIEPNPSSCLGGLSLDGSTVRRERGGGAVRFGEEHLQPKRRIADIDPRKQRSRHDTKKRVQRPRAGREVLGTNRKVTGMILTARNVHEKTEYNRNVAVFNPCPHKAATTSTRQQNTRK